MLSRNRNLEDQKQQRILEPKVSLSPTSETLSFKQIYTPKKKVPPHYGPSISPVLKLLLQYKTTLVTSRERLLSPVGILLPHLRKRIFLMGSLQKPNGMGSSALLETSCGYLLQELQVSLF